jgi:hypothetical protein
VNRKVLVPVLLVAALGVTVENWLYFRGSTQPPRAAPPQQDDSDSSELDEGTQQDSTASIEPLPVLSNEALAARLLGIDHARSPFLIQEEEKREVLLTGPVLPKLGGTLIGDKRRVAWVDGRPRREGDRHGDFLVANVDKGRVVLVRDGERYTLELSADGEGGR